MSLVLGNCHSDKPSNQQAMGIGKKRIGRGNTKYHPSVWGDRFAQCSPNDFEVDVQIKQRAENLKEEVRKMLLDANISLQKLNLINETQRLGFAYHFEKEIKNALQRIYAAHIDDENDGDDLQACALRFRLLRQEGYNVSSDVFKKFQDVKGEFKATLKNDYRGLLSLYEAAYLAMPEEDILDEAITFTKENLQSALPHLSSPFSALVRLALEVPLHKRVERLQSRHYISIYEEEKERNDILLEFAKLNFNMLQLLHRKEISEISRWWKELDFARKLPFARDRVVECYYWILHVYFEPHYSRARTMMTIIISLTSLLDDIYDLYGTLEELELYTTVIQRWDREAMDQLPEYMKLHFDALVSAVDKFEDELRPEGEAYRTSYLKKAFGPLVEAYIVEQRWASTSYKPTLEEYLENAIPSSAYPMLTVSSFVGMGNVVTKEVFEWAMNVPKVVRAACTICRLRDDIESNQLEQERVHVPSAVQCYIKDNSIPYKESCKAIRVMAASAWKDINKECMEPLSVPRQVIMRPLNLARAIEVIYQHRDGYTNSEYETKDNIKMLLVDPFQFNSGAF